jgi:hypothetical protein
MRQALQDSLAGALLETIAYPKGSIVVCTSCAKPIYKLDRGLGAGDKAGRAASAFKPIGLWDLVDLQWRAHGLVDAGLTAVLRGWTADEMKAHVARIGEPVAGDPMLCPVCGDVYVQARTAEVSDTQDRAYVIELLTIPPRVA